MGIMKCTLYGDSVFYWLKFNRPRLFVPVLLIITPTFKKEAENFGNNSIAFV